MEGSQGYLLTVLQKTLDYKKQITKKQVGNA
jgi:hypothetical protein